MKKLLLISIILILFGEFGFTQILHGSKADSQVQGAQTVRYKDFSDVPVFIRFRESVSLNHQKALNLTFEMANDSDFGLELIQTQKNRDHQITHRYRQTINNIPLEFSRWHIHTEGERVFAMNGELINNPNIVSSFNITENDALQIALNHINAEEYMWEDEAEESLLKRFKGNSDATYFPTGEKVIVPSNIMFSGSEYHSAYKFDIYSKIPHNRKNIYVDAATGEILFELQTMTSYVEGTANTVYSGEQTITTEYYNNMYRLRDGTRGNGVETFNCQNTADYNSAVDFWDDDNYWDNVNPQLNQYATDAHFATAATYDYFLEVHGRNSIDGNGHALHSYIHFSLIDYGMSSNVNAFWNGQWMTYGDGNPDIGITPLTTVDICAHEITHGLTSHTSQLIYQDEPGALNEAMSDIFGAAVEWWAVPEFADWTIGEDIGYIIRSMENPKSRNKPDTYLGEFWVFGDEDYGGVHTNNGPLCYWFYLISEGGSGVNDNGHSYTVDPIGIEKAEQIAFRMQTVYFTPTSEYIDAWFYGMQATADLYGECSPETKSVGDAFYAIGVSDPYIHEAVAEFTTNFSENCEPPLEVKFLNHSYNGYEYLWDFGDGNTSTELEPTHIYEDFGEYNVSLTVFSSECGDNTTIKEGFVKIDPELPCVTIMPTSGSITINNCAGFIYDHGGPNNNYYDNTNSRVTLNSDDAEHYVLLINHLDIEPGSGATCNYDYIAFYDGLNTSAPLINGTTYCNTTGNPGIIYSSGNAITIQFYTDQAVNMSGFEIEYYCITGDDNPIALFNFDKSFSCEGLIEFTDNSINNPIEWNWNFGDGNTSIIQNPKHFYTENGLYTVSLTVTNANGEHTNTQEDIIIIAMPDAPDFVESIDGCINTDFDILINLEGEAQWYMDIYDSEPIHTGNFWLHEPISNDVNYTVREKVLGEDYIVGASNNTAGGGYFGNEEYVHYLVFDAYTDFTINTVQVNAEGHGMRQIALRDKYGQVIQQVHAFAYNGPGEMTLNINVPAGEDLQLVGMGAPNLFRTSNSNLLDYPYEIDGVVSIKHSSAGTDPTGYYYYFYDWDITTADCLSKPTYVLITANECESMIQDNSKNQINIYPNPGDGIVSFSGLSPKKRYKLTVRDISGKVVLIKELYSNNSVNLSEFSKGVYLLNISGNDKSAVFKYVLE